MLLQAEERAVASHSSTGHFGMRRELCHYYHSWATSGHAAGEVPTPPAHLLVPECDRDVQSDCAFSGGGGRSGGGGFGAFLRRGLEFGSRLGMAIVTPDSVRRQHSATPMSSKRADTMPTNGYHTASAQYPHSAATIAASTSYSSGLCTQSSTPGESKDTDDELIWADCLSAAASADQCSTPNHSYSTYK